MNPKLTIEDLCPIYVRVSLKLLFEENVEKRLMKYDTPEQQQVLKKKIEKMILTIARSANQYEAGVREKCLDLVGECPDGAENLKLREEAFDDLCEFIDNLLKQAGEQNTREAEKESNIVRKARETFVKSNDKEAQRETFLFHNETFGNATAAQAQHQTTSEKQQLMRKETFVVVDENVSHFDMLNTDDEFDESPPVPEWSKEEIRRHAIRVQSHLNADLVDLFFSVEPVNVDLRSIFPAIDSRKLARSSSAVWNTPPRYSEYQKTQLIDS